MMLSKRSKLIRIDRSKDYLRKWYSQGFRAVKIKLVDVSCRECRSMRDVELYIWNLLRKDNPLFRVTHPNCQCGLLPIDESNINHKDFEHKLGYGLKKQVDAPPPVQTKPISSVKITDTEPEETPGKPPPTKTWSPTKPQSSDAPLESE